MIAYQPIELGGNAISDKNHNLLNFVLVATRAFFI